MEHCFIFTKDKFTDFFQLLKQFGKVWAPVRVSSQSFSFKQVDSYEQIAFEALRTILPPKKLFFKQEETLFTYDKQGFKDANIGETKQVLFGVHPCDLAGLGIMDTVYSAPPADNHYWKCRQQTLVVGLSCMPDKFCFCKSMGTDSPTTGYDIFLTDIDDSNYFIQVQTPQGMSFLESGKQLFNLASEAQKELYKQFWVKRSEAFEIGFESSNLPTVVDMEWNNNIWDELGQRCLSCGNCTFVCPTCYCFDIVDIASLNGESGERKREWDSCQIVGFAKVGGDFNFRPGPVDRLKFWYRHKLHGFEDPAAIPTCVGCGRCTVSCPSGIDDIVKVVLHLQGSNIKPEGEPPHES